MIKFDWFGDGFWSTAGRFRMAFTFCHHWLGIHFNGWHHYGEGTWKDCSALLGWFKVTFIVGDKRQ